MGSAISLSNDLAADARRLVSENPMNAVQRFRAQIAPLMSAGRAWVVEPAVRVLLTELRRNDAWEKVGMDAHRLLEDAERAQLSALSVAVAAHNIDLTQNEPDGAGLGDQIVLAAKSSLAAVPPIVEVPAIEEVEDVEVSWITLERARCHSVFESRIGDDVLLLDKVRGVGAHLALPRNVFRYDPKPAATGFGRILDSFRGDRDADAAEGPQLRQRILSALFYMPPDQAMLVTLIDGDSSNPSMAEIYVAHVGGATFNAVRAVALDHMSVGVRRPVRLDAKQAFLLAEHVSDRRGAAEINGFAIGVHDVN